MSPRLRFGQELHRRATIPTEIPGEDRTYGSGLFVDLVPKTAWYSNVRAMVTPSDWQRISRMVRERTNYTCEACGKKGEPRFMDCHERWRFEDGVQTLMRLVCLCKACHEVTHFGLATSRGRKMEALAHLIEVRGFTRSEAILHVSEAIRVFREQSRRDWRPDVSILEGLVRINQNPEK